MLRGTTNAEKLFNFCLDNGMTEAGAAAAVANSDHESGVNPRNHENYYESASRIGLNDDQYVAAVDSGTYTKFDSDSAGFGICQWTSSKRKKNLYNYLKGKNVSIADFEGQAEFMVQELKQNKTLWTLMTTSSDTRAIAAKMMLEFEIPADRSVANQNKRADTAEKYLAQYGTDNVVHPALEKLAQLGVINSLDMWKKEYRKTPYLSTLITKAAEVLTTKGTRCVSVSVGVDELVAAGVINTPSYWKTQTGNVGEMVKALGGAAKASVAASKPAEGVTEQQLRQYVCDIINSWVGATKGSAKHLEILNIYNSHKPLARGYTMKTSDAYCACTVSAAWIKAGITEFTGTEVGVEKFITVAKNLGIWVEDDTYVPKIGDACVYDWDDNANNFATTDNQNAADHIGIVTVAGAQSFTVTEGNMSGGKVGKRTMQVNGRYIRGFIAPDYAKAAKSLKSLPIEVSPTAATAGKSYTVVQGDSLWGIAQKMLGSGSRYPEIVQLNGIVNNTIHPGMVLKLP